jgi:hypothetical protein
MDASAIIGAYRRPLHEQSSRSLPLKEKPDPLFYTTYRAHFTPYIAVPGGKDFIGAK